MIITCPCEKKQFTIDSSLIPQEGRELQCGSCERVWFYKPKNESKASLALNENIFENKIEPDIETNDKNHEFSKNLQKEKVTAPEIKNKNSKEISNKVKKLENENKIKSHEVILYGENEIKSKKIKFKTLETGKEKLVKIEDLPNEIKQITH